MSWGYMFYSPTRLPLLPAELSEETVHSFTDVEMVKATLGTHLPALTWDPDPEGALASGSVIDHDAQYEFTVRVYEPPAGTPEPARADGRPSLIVAVRCSGRIESAPFAQRLCDATGWIAFDDRVYLFQPHRSPMPGGGG
jgi:hypothetical protein